MPGRSVLLLRNKMYNNIPTTANSNLGSDAYNNSYTYPLELETNTLNLMKGFFESKGFDKSSSETISVTFIKQAKQDGYNPLSVLDSIKKLDTVALNSLITEILNFNRYKTSYLGSKSNLSPFEPVARNIAA